MSRLNVKNRTLAIMDNLALLHATCNRKKGNRLTLEQLRLQNDAEKHLYKPMHELVHLGKAIQFANERIATHIMESSGQYRIL